MIVLELRTRRAEMRDTPGKTNWVGRVGPAVLVVLVGLVVWQVAVDVSGVRPQVLPSPLRVVNGLGIPGRAVGEHRPDA